jgi:hypothetical protein
MKDDEKPGHGKGFDRRDFLLSASGVLGTAVTGIAWGATPCPPSTLSVSGGTSATTGCGPSSLPTLTLTSAAASGTHGWTFGQAFARGDVPSGSFITSDAGTTQADIRNRWPDGSVKFAVMSGVSSLTQNAPRAVRFATSTSAPGGANVAEPANLDVAVTFSGGVSGTYTLQSCLGIDRSTWSKANAGRVRQILGPVMSEFHYYRPTSDAHVAVWFYVRRYANGATEVETVIENGWLNVGGPGARNYTVSVAVGGATKYSGSLNHYHHTRWSRVDWVGTDPQITPKHDAAYLRKTRLVPNYGYTSPSAAAFNNFQSAINPAPFAIGQWSNYMPGTGAHDAIGLLPRWEALYCTSGDRRAYAATISNNRGSGRWPIHYRDENTGRVALYSSYPAMTLTTGWGTPPPAPGGGGPDGGWDIPHHPSNGYLAYLIEGRWTALESLQFSAFVAIAESNPDTRFGGGVLACFNAPLTTRGAAWAWRTVGQAAAASPAFVNGAAPTSADAALQTAFAASVNNTCDWMNKRFVTGTTSGGIHKNTIGWLGQYDRYADNGPANEWWGGCWMVQYQSLALGHISDLGIENMPAANLVAVRDHSYDNALLRLGNESTFNFRHGANYAAPYLKNSTNQEAPSFMTPAEMYASYKAAFSMPAISANAGDTLKGHSSNADMNGSDTSNDAAGFWAVVLSVVSMAVDHGKSGAAAKRALITAASNYDPAAHGASDDPTFALVPR